MSGMNRDILYRGRLLHNVQSRHGANDHRIFFYLKHFLGGKHFATDDEWREAAQDWLCS